MKSITRDISKRPRKLTKTPSDYFMIEDQDKSFYITGIQALQHRLKKCVDRRGDYDINKPHFLKFDHCIIVSLRTIKSTLVIYSAINSSYVSALYQFDAYQMNRRIPRFLVKFWVSRFSHSLKVWVPLHMLWNFHILTPFHIWENWQFVTHEWTAERHCAILWSAEMLSALTMRGEWNSVTRFVGS